MAKVGIPCLALKVEIPCLAIKVEIPCLDRAGQGRYSCYNRRTVHTEHFKFEMILSHPGYVQWQGDNWTFFTLSLYSERVTTETFLTLCLYSERISIKSLSHSVCTLKGWQMKLSHPGYVQWQGDHWNLFYPLLCTMKWSQLKLSHPLFV